MFRCFGKKRSRWSFILQVQIVTEVFKKINNKLLVFKWKISNKRIALRNFQYCWKSCTNIQKELGRRLFSLEFRDIEKQLKHQTTSWQFSEDEKGGQKRIHKVENPARIVLEAALLLARSEEGGQWNSEKCGRNAPRPIRDSAREQKFYRLPLRKLTLLQPANPFGNYIYIRECTRNVPVKRAGSPFSFDRSLFIPPPSIAYKSRGGFGTFRDDCNGAAIGIFRDRLMWIERRLEGSLRTSSSYFRRKDIKKGCKSFQRGIYVRECAPFFFYIYQN